MKKLWEILVYIGLFILTWLVMALLFGVAMLVCSLVGVI